MTYLVVYVVIVGWALPTTLWFWCNTVQTRIINRRTRWEPLAQPLVEKEETPMKRDV